MPKYRKKPIIVDAEVYEAGMEDGFSCVPFVYECKYSYFGEYFKCDHCELDIPKKPWLGTPEGSQYINEGDYIILDKHGANWRLNAERFEEIYEKIED